MESGLSNLLSVSIDFENSHLFFPTIIHWIMAVLFALILIMKVVPFMAAVRRGSAQCPLLAKPGIISAFSAPSS